MAASFLSNLAGKFGVIREPQEYTVMTWNVGTDSDYRRVYDADPSKREDLFRKIFASIKNLDLIGLQEVFDIKESAFFPKTEWKFHRNEDNDTSIVWNNKRFKLIADESITYDNIAGTTILMLEDRATRLKIRIVSAHIIGFNLENRNGQEQGYDQLKQLLSSLQEPSADSTVLCMDANSDKTHSNRLEQLKDYRDDGDESPTSKNQEVGDVKLDWIFAKGLLEMQPIALPKELEENPSDHLPHISKIIINKK